MNPKPLAERFADYACAVRFDDLPREVVDKTKAIILHDLAVAFGGLATEEAKVALDHIARRANGAGDATVIGSARKWAPLDAAFANTVMMRALRMEDSILPSFVHPGAMLVPAALAVGEQTGASGRAVIASLVAGYEVVGKIAGTYWSWHSRRTASHMFGGFGVAVVAAKLAGLDAQQTACAIAYAGNLAAMITYGFQDFQYGLVTRNGMMAAEYGACRAPFPHDALEGPYGFYAAQLGGVPDDLAARLTKLGVEFDILTAVLKPHPCTAINLVPIRLFRGLIAAHGLAADNIRTVRVTRTANAAMVPNIHNYGPFAEAYEATSSLPFALGLVMVDGDIDPRRFWAPNDPAVHATMSRVKVEFIETNDLLAHRVEVETVAGARHHAEGGKEVLPVPDPVAILARYGTQAIGAEKADRLVSLVRNLESVADVREVTACLA
jgi:2-methylcitrate dehydratase PrpD